MSDMISVLEDTAQPPRPHAQGGGGGGGHQVQWTVGTFRAAVIRARKRRFVRWQANQMRNAAPSGTAAVTSSQMLQQQQLQELQRNQRSAEDVDKGRDEGASERLNKEPCNASSRWFDLMRHSGYPKGRRSRRSRLSLDRLLILNRHMLELEVPAGRSDGVADTGGVIPSGGALGVSAVPRVGERVPPGPVLNDRAPSVLLPVIGQALPLLGAQQGPENTTIAATHYLYQDGAWRGPDGDAISFPGGILGGMPSPNSMMPPLVAANPNFLQQLSSLLAASSNRTTSPVTGIQNFNGISPSQVLHTQGQGPSPSQRLPPSGILQLGHHRREERSDLPPLVSTESIRDLMIALGDQRRHSVDSPGGDRQRHLFDYIICYDHTKGPQTSNQATMQPGGIHGPHALQGRQDTVYRSASCHAGSPLGVGEVHQDTGMTGLRAGPSRSLGAANGAPGWMTLDHPTAMTNPSPLAFWGDFMTRQNSLQRAVPFQLSSSFQQPSFPSIVPQNIISAFQQPSFLPIVPPQNIISTSSVDEEVIVTGEVDGFGSKLQQSLLGSNPAAMGAILERWMSTLDPKSRAEVLVAWR